MMANGIAFCQLRKVLTSSLLSRAGTGLDNTRCLLRGISSSVSCRQHQSNGDGTEKHNSDDIPPTSPDAPVQPKLESLQAVGAESIAQGVNATQKQDDDFLSESSSYCESEEQEYEHSVKQQILKASLPFVHEHGWTRSALEAGASAEGLPPVAQGMFPRGGAELVHYFYSECNKNLSEILAQRVELAKEEGLEKPKTVPFIRDAVTTRLQMIIPYLDQWPQAMGIQTLPQNAGESWGNLINLADDIWFYAGDRSIDMNWYTKRVALAGVYKTSEIFMLQDNSPDQEETWAFVERRLEDFQRFGKGKQNVEQSSSVLKEGLLGFCIMGRNMLGLNSRDR